MKKAKVVIKSKNKDLYNYFRDEYSQYDSNIKMIKQGEFELQGDGCSFNLCAYTVNILDTLQAENSLNQIEDIKLFTNGSFQENILEEFLT